jgi:hypothetical protein
VNKKKHEKAMKTRLFSLQMWKGKKLKSIHLPQEFSTRFLTSNKGRGFCCFFAFLSFCNEVYFTVVSLTAGILNNVGALVSHLRLTEVLYTAHTTSGAKHKKP